MGRPLQSLLIIFFLIAGSLCYSQTSVKVSDPRIELKDNIVHISYDILNNDPEERYSISIAINDENGKPIDAKALNGDIGEEITGGNNKQITWNLEADNIYIDAYIVVQIFARIIPKQEDVISQDESKEKDIVSKEKEALPEIKSTNYNRAGLVLQSLAFPGLGLARVTGNPHWIRGLAGYGCLAGSIVLNRQAVNTYNGIAYLVSYDDVTEVFNKSVQQDNISEVLAYSAIGIWVIDFIWTLVGTSDLNKAGYYGDSGGFSIGGTVDPLSNAPLVSVQYRF